MLTTYLLDTNQVSKILDGHESVMDRVAHIGLARLAVSVIVCGELTFMARHSQFTRDNLERVSRLLQRMRTVPVDLETAVIFGEVKQLFLARFGPKPRKERSKVRTEQLGLRDNDLWIASTAIRHNCTLVSADSHFERIREVREFRLEAWWSPGK